MSRFVLHSFRSHILTTRVAGLLPLPSVMFHLTLLVFVSALLIVAT